MTDTASETQTSVIEAAFQEYTEDRKDIAILLINQHVRSVSLPRHTLY